MRIYQTLRKRGLALFLALIMCLSLVQVPAFAAEDDASEPADALVMDVTGPGVQEPEAVPEEESPAPESEEITVPDTQEEPEADEPEEYAPEYAAVEELEAAFEAAVEALEDGDVEGGIAALEEYLNIFDRLSPEDQEANQEAREAAGDYLQTLLDSLEGIEDEDVEALGQTITEKIIVVEVSGSKVMGRLDGSKYSPVRSLQTSSSSSVSNGVEPFSWSYTNSTNATFTAKAYSSASSSNKWGIYLPAPDELYEDLEYTNYKWGSSYASSWYSISNISTSPYSPTSAPTGNTIYLYIQNPSVPHTHSYSWGRTTDPTCYTDGTETYKCSCGATNGTRPIPASEAYHTWGSWYDNSNGKEQRDCNYNVHHEYRDIQVQNVTLNYRDRGVAFGDTETYTKGANVTVKVCTNTRNGYTFIGWDTDSSADKVVYTAGKTFTINTNTTLYAVWEKTPGTKLGNFTVKKSFAGLDADAKRPDVSLTYEAWRTKDDKMVGDKEFGTVSLSENADGTYSGNITPTVWDILTNALPENERLRYENVVVITEDTESAKVDGYTWTFAAVYPADGKKDGPDAVKFTVDGATFEKDLLVKNTYIKNPQPAPPALTITKSVDKSSIKVGSELTYTIKVVNNGKTDATNVVVTDTLPAELTYVIGSTDGCEEATAHGNDLTWKLGNIKASEEVEFTFKATAKKTGNIENVAVVNCAEKVTDTSDPVPTAIYSFTVTKTNNGFHSIKGSGKAVVHYTVTVTNNGSISLYGLNIKDILKPVVKVNNAAAAGSQASMVLKPTSLTLNGEPVGKLGNEQALDVTSEEITTNWDLVLDRNTEFKSNDVVTLEYDIEVRNLTRDTLYVNLKNTATCGTWTAQSAPAMRSAFRAADDGYVEESATSGAEAGSDVGGAIDPADPEKTVTVTWVDEKGNVLHKEEDVKPGEVPAADKYTELSGNEVPTKPEDAEYTYTFKEWEKTVDTDGNVTYKATYTATPKTPVPTPADWGKLTLTKTANKTQARAGEDITYTIRVTNNTGKNLTGIRVSEPLDTRVTFKSAAPAGYDATSGVWTIASLANGASATLTLTVTVKDGVTNATIRNTAAITDASTTGPDPEKLPDGTRPGDTADVTVPEEDARRVTVTWLNWNGDRLDRADWNTDEREPSYSGRRPTRPDSARYTYTFAGWGNREVDEDGNVTYTALFDRERIDDDDDDDDRPTGGGNTGGGNTGGNTGGGTTTIPDTQTPLDPGTTIIDQEVPLAGAVGLNDADHFAYVIGYEDGTVRPLNNISRAEVATIFFRLMTDDYRQTNWSTVNSFTDVKEGDWYNNAISTCARAGALKGRGDGSIFDPNANITRAEFAVIAARFLDSSYVDDGKGDFADTADHWAAKEIRLAAKAGWVNGNGNTFNPDAYITRAEVMTIVNRMLDRTPDKDHMLPDMKKWSDNPEDAWYYEAVQEATNEHDYTRDETAVESWTQVKEHRDWAALELGWAANGGAAAPQSDTETQGLPDGI